MTTQPTIILQAFESTKVIPVFYHEDPEVCAEVMKACYTGGIRVFEFTNRGEQARQNFAHLRDLKAASMPDMQLGIGTIKNVVDARTFTDMGADFIVCPVVDPETATYCQRAGILWIPGCMTPTEISVAEKNGAALVKLFPGSALGPEFVKAIKPLFPGLKFMPTGGVEPEAANLKAWFGAGVVCVGMGSNLIPKDILADRDWKSLGEKIKQTFALLRSLQ
ncbi:bifunctional 4-hydroxy-2-oxoglutarate aldolase/2-dehydro-3-deoxy-phosphogluconate aldolase [Chitinophaga rhizosphaerae]|uniref:bifunctional 4-hydroxy-2-oxoglutarate aldolase/2-dehydro-3-deoxy-phosphogluconate aldolase n=1 Tax=Chitinophaga rhizosphaerae TaxID=1864947 RepID=UPI000F8026AA|nr:bifunctional 4-hydroxy-2-oxoglutarate aldolase/2-dehydro-3-deoxy-phosphogluconate aldolase [Chitinophaga rhizosphaerae]